MSDARTSKVNFNRNFFLLLYPDNDEHMQALKMIQSTYEEFAYILHDRDVYDGTEEIKKNHIHAVIKFRNQRYASAVASELGIEQKFVRGCNLNASLLYLVHFNDVDKFQYDISAVQGTLVSKLKKLIQSTGKEEDARILDMMNYIDATTTAITFADFAKWCAINGYWADFRRSSMIFDKYLKQHNSHYFIRLRSQGIEQITDEDIERAIYETM